MKKTTLTILGIMVLLFGAMPAFASEPAKIDTAQPGQNLVKTPELREGEAGITSISTPAETQKTEVDGKNAVEGSGEDNLVVSPELKEGEVGITRNLNPAPNERGIKEETKEASAPVSEDSIMYTTTAVKQNNKNSSFLPVAVIGAALAFGIALRKKVRLN